MSGIEKYNEKIKALEAEIAIMRERYRILAETTPALLFEYRPDMDIMVYYYNFPDNHRTWTVSDYRAYTVENSIIHPSHVRSVLKVLYKAAKSPAKGEVDYLSRISGDNYEWHRAYYSSVMDEEGRVITVVGRIQNIHESVTERHALMHRMETDALTGLYSREAAAEKIQKWIQSNPTAEAYMIMVVIDNVNDINKTYGHAAGDDVLKQTARLLRQYFEDMGISARYGGAEFIVFVMDETIGMVESRVDSFLDIIANSVRAFDKPAKCSIGIAGRVSKYDGFEDMFNRADNAMNLARQSGQNSYYIYRK